MSSTQVTQQNLHLQTVTYGKLSWIDIENPTERETDYLAGHYPFHTLDLDDCLSRIQRPKIDAYDDYIFLVSHFPVFNLQARVTTSSQVSIFLAEDYLITLHKGDLKPLTKFFKDCSINEATKKEIMGRSTGYLMYIILDRLVNYCFPIMNKIGTNIEIVEEKVFSDNAREAVRDLSVIRRDVISYRRIIKPQTEVFEWLEKSELHIIKEDPEVYFGDLADHNRKIMDTLDEYKEVIEGLNDTNNTLSSFRINQVIRILTIISTMMLPPTLIASIYGMNLKGLPLADNPYSFAIVVFIMLTLVAGMLTLFRLKRWI